MIQIIPALRPCLKATDIRSLGNGVKVGETRTPGDVKDNDDIAADIKYVVQGTGTIDYDSVTYAVGREFTGDAGETDFTRSATTARVIKTKGVAIQPAGLSASDYIVVGTVADSLTYPSILEGVEDVAFSPGDIFRGATGVPFSITQGSNTKVYEIDDNPAITTALAVHHIGSVTFPNTLDYSQALEFGDSQGVAVKGTRLNTVYFWNFGSVAAKVMINSYSSSIERSSGAMRSNEQIELPPNGVAYEWPPSYPFLQAGLGGITGDEAAVEAKQNAYWFQTEARDVWIRPILETSAGFQ